MLDTSDLPESVARLEDAVVKSAQVHYRLRLKGLKKVRVVVVRVWCGGGGGDACVCVFVCVCACVSFHHVTRRAALGARALQSHHANVSAGSQI